MRLLDFMACKIKEFECRKDFAKMLASFDKCILNGVV